MSKTTEPAASLQLETASGGEYGDSDACSVDVRRFISVDVSAALNDELRLTPRNARRLAAQLLRAADIDEQNLCPCGKPRAHLDADEDSAEWSCVPVVSR